MKYGYLILLVLMVGCGSDDDGSDPMTYSSCIITKSNATSAKDRVNDTNQCWDEVDYRSKEDALSWCTNQVKMYMNSQYTLEHTVEYQVSSNNCIPLRSNQLKQQ